LEVGLGLCAAALLFVKSGRASVGSIALSVALGNLSVAFAFLSASSAGLSVTSAGLSVASFSFRRFEDFIRRSGESFRRFRFSIVTSAGPSVASFSFRRFADFIRRSRESFRRFRFSIRHFDWSIRRPFFFPPFRRLYPSL